MNKMVYIVILNWNGWRDTMECIRSCRGLTYPHFEILIVDNGSEDDSVNELQTAFPELTLIEVADNKGFAGGNNIGIRYALEKGADYLWLLNNDTTVEPESLTELVKVAESGGNVGMVGSKSVLYSNPNILHFAGGNLDLKSGLTQHIGDGEEDRGQYDQTAETDYITGCSLLVKREVIEKIGLMPEDYFLYYEETDWCMSARVAGYALRMAMKSKILHKVSASVQNFSASKLYYLTRNRLYFLQRHGKAVSWMRRLFADGRRISYFVLTGQFRIAAMMVLGYRHWRQGYMGPLHGLTKISRQQFLAGAGPKLGKESV